MMYPFQWELSGFGVRLDITTITMTVKILIFGAGWLSAFLIPLCKERQLTYAATTRDGSDGTLTVTFVFDASSDVIETYRNLPDASTVLITFPITEPAGPTQSAIQPRFMLLGATGIWEVCVSHSIQVSSLIVRLGSQKALFGSITDKKSVQFKTSSNRGAGVVGFISHESKLQC